LLRPKNQDLQVRNGCRIFIVEDEPMVRSLLQDMLAGLGHDVCASAAGLDDAIQTAATSNFEVAILDINLNGIAVYPAADVLIQRGIPFIFATGIDQELPERFRQSPRVQKPFLEFQLQDALDRIVR
jgi:CheY-like chemotaxis protein